MARVVTLEDAALTQLWEERRLALGGADRQTYERLMAVAGPIYAVRAETDDGPAHRGFVVGYRQALDFIRLNQFPHYNLNDTVAYDSLEVAMAIEGEPEVEVTIVTGKALWSYVIEPVPPERLAVYVMRQNRWALERMSSSDLQTERNRVPRKKHHPWITWE